MLSFSSPLSLTISWPLNNQNYTKTSFEELIYATSLDSEWSFVKKTVRII